MIFKRAIKKFGLTKDPREAGWILPNGSMLDFSGKIYGFQGRRRELDHSEVAKEIFFKRGAISVHVAPDFHEMDVRLFASAPQPTKPQWATLRSIITESRQWRKLVGHDDFTLYLDVHGRPIINPNLPAKAQITGFKLLESRTVEHAKPQDIARIKWLLRAHKVRERVIR